MNVLGKGSKQGFLLMRHILEKKYKKESQGIFFQKITVILKKQELLLLSISAN